MSCHRTIIRLSAVLAVVALATGCGDGDSPAAPPTPEPARPTSAGSGQGTADLDRAALVALYNATNGPNWTNNDNWLADVPLEEWYGVVTGSDGRVTRLSLWENNLTGPIPPELTTYYVTDIITIC